LCCRPPRRDSVQPNDGTKRGREGGHAGVGRGERKKKRKEKGRGGGRNRKRKKKKKKLESKWKRREVHGLTRRRSRRALAHSGRGLLQAASPCC
jgi:hypothetical protein